MATWRYNETATGHIVEFYVEGQITAADLDTASPTHYETVPLWPNPAFRRHARINVGEAFEDSGASALTAMDIQIGDTFDANGLMLAEGVSADDSPPGS